MTAGTTLTRSRLFSAAMVCVLAAALAPLPGTASASPVAAPASAQPASMPFADSAFESVWKRNDQPVASKAVARSWMWGPAPLATGFEPYADAKDGSGKRLVQYFDKSRMEINDPKLSPTDKWFVTNGLLTVELISGRMQVGDSKFETTTPAGINIASDPDDGNAPTYASFGTVSNTSAGEKRRPDKSASGYATERIDRKGEVADDPSKKIPEARIAYFEKATGHNVPKVFWEYLNSTGPVRNGVGNVTKPLMDPWVFAMGLPISDAYWANVKIEGKMQDVLIQAFERRVLTYAPGLPTGWQVQMGNIGQHYYQWRYGDKEAGPQKQVKGTPSLPAYLSIPSLAVTAKVEHVGVDSQNNMDIPKDPFNAAWFSPGTVPGRIGNAVMDGHLDWFGVKEAIFYYLGELKPGDRVYVRDDKGVERAFVVTKQQVCTWNNCPLQDIFGKANTARLNLITCHGNYNRTQQNYDRRLVVFTEAVQ
jgi:sortase (surface protein transpeptidase)